jgi:hypothetical protein
MYEKVKVLLLQGWNPSEGRKHILLHLAGNKQVMRWNNRAVTTPERPVLLNLPI